MADVDPNQSPVTSTNEEAQQPQQTNDNAATTTTTTTADTNTESAPASDAPTVAQEDTPTSAANVASTQPDTSSNNTSTGGKQEDGNIMKDELDSVLDQFHRAHMESLEQIRHLCSRRQRAQKDKKQQMEALKETLVLAQQYVANMSIE